MTLASDKGNFQYFPTDCPHREKNGWFGDVSLSAEQLYLNFGCRKDLREWAYSITKAQRDDGKLPAIVPSTDWGCCMYVCMESAHSDLADAGEIVIQLLG